MEIKIFNHEQFGQIRICQNEGKEWFCLSDVCKALEINNPRDVKKRLQQRGVVTIDTPTCNQHGAMVMQKMTYIDEANLYRCIFQNRKGGDIPVKEEDDEKTILCKAMLIYKCTIEKKRRC